MPTLETYQWEKAVLGERIQYPGHPLVIAAMIMDRYSSFEAAGFRKPGADFYNAISDSFIPGSGCAVSAAMEVLKRSLHGQVDLAKQEADRYWNHWEQQSASNRQRAEVGREQARRIEPLFMERLAAWQSGQPGNSPYRLSDAETLPPPAAIQPAWASKGRKTGP